MFNLPMPGYSIKILGSDLNIVLFLKQASSRGMVGKTGTGLVLGMFTA